MKRFTRLVLLFPFILATWSAHAQIYMCKDASGRTITSDRPIPECAGRAVRELDKTGVTRREIPAPLTAEQKRQAKLQEEERKAEEAVADEQRRNDRAIRTRYRNEAEIGVARQRALMPVEEQMRREKAALSAAEKQQMQAQVESDAYKQKNTPVPAGVQKRADDAHKEVGSIRQALAQHEAEAAQINANYDATLQRYRELNGLAAR